MTHADAQKVCVFWFIRTDQYILKTSMRSATAGSSLMAHNRPYFRQ